MAFCDAVTTVDSPYEVVHLDLARTLGSGQILRSRPLGDGRFEVASGGRLATVWQEPVDGGVPVSSRSVLHVESDAVDVAYWRRVMSVDDDYGRIWGVLSSLHDDVLDEAMAAGDGVRVLHMDPFEAFVTSVITQNNNVPRIRVCVERICVPPSTGDDPDACGSDSLPPFPDATELIDRLDAGGRSLGLGYRLPYLRGLCEAWLDGKFDGMVADAAGRQPFGAGELESCERDMSALLSQRGIGPKVASCCCLFGLGHASALPVDVWIRRFNERYDMPWVPEIAGIQQQYVFEWVRTRPVDR